MQFVVPKFIGQEMKLVGPLTFKQLMIVFFAAGLSLLFYKIFPFFLFLISFIIIMPAGIGLAIVRVDGRPLLLVAANALHFLVSPKIFIWQKRGRKSVVFHKIEIKRPSQKLPLKAGGLSRLKRLKTTIEIKTK